MKLTEKRTKLIATVGPTSCNYDTLATMIKNGVSTLRANFSHGDYNEQQQKFILGKQISHDLGIPISLMLDTKGPEIRVGQMQNGAVQIDKNQELLIHCHPLKYQNFLGTASEISVSYDMAPDLKVGNLILIDDGKLTVKVIAINLVRKEVLTLTINSHKLKSNKRINLPGIDFNLPFLSQKDQDDIIFGIDQKIDYIAASFVNRAENVLQIRNLLAQHNASHIQIIAKIESVLGIQNLDEIIKVSDGIMVARGDLGLEIPYQDVPYYQKMMIRKCRDLGKPVIVATQMLDSMENSPQPTRAEVTDVYFATELGADATMLSGESAQGLFPVEAVKVMATINKRAEKEFYKKLFYEKNLENVWKQSAKDQRDIIAKTISEKTKEGTYKYAVVLSRTGNLLKRVAQYRPNTIIIGILADEKLINSFGITSSVFVSLDSKKWFELGKKSHQLLKSCLEPFTIVSGEKFLVVENEKISEYTY